MNESGIVYEELQTLKKRNAVASSLFKAEKQDDTSWIASAKETSEFISSQRTENS